MANDITRLMALVDKSDSGCWVWKGCISSGRPFFWFNGRSVRAYRAAYELTRGAIEKGMTIDHLCRNPLCVNPEHMEVVTMAENVMRGLGVGAQNAVKTHCPAGHPYSGKNLYITSTGRRMCKQCRAFAPRKPVLTHHKTHCPKGHPYSGENLYVTAEGKWQCRICKREAAIRSLERKYSKPS